MRRVAVATLKQFDAELLERDVRTDPELERRYLFEIPVLLLCEKEVVRHRTTAEDLAKRLRALGVPPAR